MSFYHKLVKFGLRVWEVLSLFGKLNMKYVLQLSVIGVGMVMGGAAFAQDWATSCGHEPKAPAINVSNVTNYNASVEQFTAYNKSARIYYACISKQTHAKQLTISQKAKTDMELIQKVSTDVRMHIAANLTKMQAELKAGGKKLGATSKK